jgi:type IV pilus assembly protein PilA
MTRRRRGRGFTLLELMVVIAIVGILATLAIPSYQQRIARSQVKEGIAMAAFAESAVQARYVVAGVLPADNTAAGLPPSDRVVGNYVTSLEVHDGSLVITFGNHSTRLLAGKKLSLRAATVVDYPQVPIAWVCGTAAVPSKMTVRAGNETNIPDAFLPLDCRGAPRQ